jgi:hypothetical protein
MSDLNSQNKDSLLVKRELKKALVRLGVPESSILVDGIVCLSNGRRVDADLLIMEGETVVAQFEVRLCPDAFARACWTLRDLPKFHRCFAVTIDHNEVVVSAISKSRIPQWIPLSNSEALKALLEDSMEATAVAMAEAEKRAMVASVLESARLYVGIGGLIAILFLGALELFGHEFSWQLYSLVFVLLALFAAMSGYVIHLKVGDNEITIGRLQGNQDLSAESKREGLALKKGYAE